MPSFAFSESFCFLNRFEWQSCRVIFPVVYSSSFHASNILSLFLLVFSVSVEKSADNPMSASCIFWSFSFIVFTIFVFKLLVSLLCALFLFLLGLSRDFCSFPKFVWLFSSRCCEISEIILKYFLSLLCTCRPRTGQHLMLSPLVLAT